MSDVMEQEGVAIGCRLGDSSHADGAAGAADVLDDNLLFQRLGHRPAQQPSHSIGRSAGRKRHDHGDDFGRIILGVGRR